MACVCLFANAQITKDLELQETHATVMCNFDDFNALHIGFYGTTENCSHYYIYGFKYKKTWLMVANQQEKVNFLVCNPPRQAEKKLLKPGSNILLEGISLAYMDNYLKFKDKKKEVKEIDIRGYYKFNRLGKKAMKGILYLDYPKVKKKFPLPWPLSLLQKDKEELKEEAEAETEQEVQELMEEATQPLELEKPTLEIPVP